MLAICSQKKHTHTLDNDDERDLSTQKQFSHSRGRICKANLEPTGSDWRGRNAPANARALALNEGQTQVSGHFHRDIHPRQLLLVERAEQTGRTLPASPTALRTYLGEI